MKQVTMIGIDLAKRSFQVHGAQADGSVAFRVKLSRERPLNFLASQPRCAVAMEPCASAYYCHPRRLKGLSAGAVEECGQDGEAVNETGSGRINSNPRAFNLAQATWTRSA